MELSNESIRRQDRLLDKDKSTELLKTGEYGVLSLQAEDGGGYGIPINFVWDGAISIYLHCAPEGRKLRCIGKQSRASFCIVGGTHVVSNKFTTLYESVILTCEAHLQLSAEERMKALTLLIEKYSPNDKALGLKYTEKSFHRTEVIRLDIMEWSGKSKQAAIIHVT